MKRSVGIFLLFGLWFGMAATTRAQTVVTTRYEYNETNQQPSAIEVETSDGLSRHTEIEYAFEVFNSLDNARQWMDVHKTIVREDSTGTPLTCRETTYINFGRWMPYEVYTGCGSDRVKEGTLSYDEYLRPERMEMASGLETDIVYQGPNITSITRRFMADGASGPTLLTQSYTWDSRHRLHTATDENGTIHRYSYDGLGRLTHIERRAPGTLVLWETLQEIDYYLSRAHSQQGHFDPLKPNYIRTQTYQTASVKDVATVYFDGLGREIQTQQLVQAGSGSVTDSVAVAFPEYDALGRPHRQWLPVGMRLSESVDPNHGFIRIDTMKVRARSYYADHPGNGTGANNRPYSETTYEASPLSRPITEQAPGAPTTVSGGSGSVVTYTYGVAAPGEGTTAPMAYTEIRDEDDRFTRTYTDGLGRERFSIRGQGATEEARTGFVYDAADRLLRVRPPNYYAEDPFDVGRLAWETVYTVDTRGLVLTKRTPDTRNTAGSGPGTFRYTYDTSGRLRYSQDPEQRALGHVAYIRYDALDRPVQAGVGRPLICDPEAKDGDPESCWNLLDPDGGTNWPDVLAPTGTRWEWLGSNRRTQYAYDDTTNTHGWPFYIDPNVTQHYTAGRPSAVTHRIEGLWESTSRWQTTQFSYNAQGLVAERRERIRIGSSTPWDLFTYIYNRAGMLTADRVTVGSHTLRHQYQYDRRGLLTTVGISHATSGSFSQILALDYAIDGAVTERHLGGQTSVPYAYDVAGRIHAIGDVTSTSDPFAALYSYTPSGLISEMETRSGAAAQDCPYSSGTCTDYWRYSFSYDGLARLTTAQYQPMGGLMRGPGYSVSNLSYDSQGNIETLTRAAPTMPHPEGTAVDQLSYTYTARTNRLASVADAVTTDLDWDAKPTSFVYNRVGSVTWTIEELTPTTYRETEIQVYDERQLPEELRIRLIATPGGAYDSTMVSYRYDTNGQRIRKQIRETAQGPDVVYERYVRDGMRLIGVFDENDNLKNWNLGGIAGLVGRADPSPFGVPIRSYYVTDYLGSIRAVVRPSGTLIEGRDYYPYGLTMPGRFYVQADTTREGFTGYEEDRETGFYYAGARFYNPALGRFLTTDRFQELYPGLSTYQYAGGNPVSIIDVNGDTLFVRGDQEAIGGFVQVANTSMGGHHMVSVGADGMVNVTATGMEGSMTEQQQAFYDALMGAASLDVGAVNINLVWSSDQVIVGSFENSTIDMADVMMFGDGPHDSAPANLIHEIVEQTQKQLHGLDFTDAHSIAITAQNQINRNELISDGLIDPSRIIRQNDRRIIDGVLTDTFRYRDGRLGMSVSIIARNRITRNTQYWD